MKGGSVDGNGYPFLCLIGCECLLGGRFEFPKLKVVINLAPSGIKKSGSHFDLAMAVSLKYRQKLSGPILDRIEVHKYVQPVDFLNLSAQEKGRSSAELRERVQRARRIQQDRFVGVANVNSNAQMSEAMIKQFCQLDSESTKLLRLAFEKFHYSARTYNKFLKTARTFADLEESDVIRKKDVSAALMSRDLDKDRRGMLVV